MSDRRDDHDFDAAKLADDEKLVARDFWDKLRATLGRVPFVEDALAAYYCAADRATPLYVKAVLMGALAYFIVPSDVIPDFIVGLGYTDDAAVLAAALAAVRSSLRERHFDKARAFLGKAEDRKDG
ncbi:MAG: YkvA family protein [Alphaproteobacteria bacterium]